MESRKGDNIPQKRFLQRLLEIGYISDHFASRTHSRETLFTEVTGNRVSDHYARNISRKVSLEIAVPWILLTSKILYQNISKFVRK